MEYRYLYMAKRIDNGEWVEGFYCKRKTRHYDNIGFHDEYKDYIIVEFSYGGIAFYNVDQTTICQCTGLKDKNGKLIWENDIVGFWDTYSTENGYAEADCIGKVVWDDETISFQVTNRLSAESYEVLDECSVIGNIFDNKEMLESEEN